MIDGLGELRPDVVAFQEAIVGDGYDQVVDLLGPDYHVVHQTVGLLKDSTMGWTVADTRPASAIIAIDRGAQVLSRPVRIQL